MFSTALLAKTWIMRASAARNLSRFLYLVLATMPESYPRFQDMASGEVSRVTGCGSGGIPDSAGA